jgi:acyl-CoA synthetase (AMP-forming)/AMP-acid ligase II
MVEAALRWCDLAAAALPAAGCAPVVGWRDGRLIGQGEWLMRVDAWQAAFAARGGRDWALLLDDPVEFAAAMYGAWHAGKRVLLPADALPHTLTLLHERIDGLAGEMPGGLQPATGAGPQARQALDAQTTEVVLFTSGSSGTPVAIAKPLALLRTEVEAQHALHGVHWTAAGGVTVWTTVSTQHIYGLLFVVLWPLAARCAIAAPRLSYPEQMAGLIGPQPAVLVSSPAHLKRLPEELDWSRVRGALRAVLSGGGPLPPEAVADGERLLGVAPTEVYGSSETGGIGWRRRALHGDGWHPVPGVQWRIDEGLLALRSPFMPDDDWHLTADRARADPEGGFVLLGRADRIAKIEERRVSLTAVEQALAASPLVAEAAALVLGGRVAAAVVPSRAGAALLAEQGRPALIRRLREALAGSVERIAWPRRWRIVGALPANPQGKLTEAALAALFDPPSPWRWIERGADAARLERQVEATLPAFEGHFPQGAILPGVVQLDWAIDAGREAFGIEVPVVRLEVLKFLLPVLPDQRLTLALQWDAAARRMPFRFESPRGLHASGRVCFAGPGDA